MAFYGDIDESDAIELADRLLEGTQKAAAKRAVKKGCSLAIERNSLANHYSHFNTMSLESCDWYADDLTDYEQRSFDALVKAVDNDIRDVSRALESDDYKLIDAGSEYGALKDRVRTYNTARFRVIPKEVEGEYFDLSDWDDELIDETLDAFINGTQRYFTLKVTVESADGLELGTDILGGFVDNNNSRDLSYAGYRSQMVHDAIKQARNLSASIALAAYPFEITWDGH